jgi:arylesterase / paraoxonase
MKNTIPVPDGPEDMLLDTISSAQPRLIVSCTKRRSRVAPGKICWVDLATHEAHDFEMEAEQEGELFQPHGIDLVKVGSEALLYVISHTVIDRLFKNGHREEIRIYKVEGSRLLLKQVITDEQHIVHPNDIAALPDGSFYFTNDTMKRSGLMRNIELMAKLRSSNLAYYSNGRFSISESNLGFANGVEHAPGNRLLLTCVFDDVLRVYDVQQGGALANKREISVCTGMDNISLCGTGQAIIAAHTNMVKFGLHRFFPGVTSPSCIYRINYDTGTVHEPPVLETNGHDISAASTALEYDNKLYVSQVFEGFIKVFPLTGGVVDET